MLAGRRLFFLQSGALVAAAATLSGCRESQAPAVASRSWRSVSRTLAGVPTSDGAGVKLLRVIGQAGRDGLDSLDPFLLLDRIHSDDPGAYILVAAARPIGEPIVRRGPFVMNTEAEIQRAFDDYRAGVLDRT